MLINEKKKTIADLKSKRKELDKQISDLEKECEPIISGNVKFDGENVFIAQLKPSWKPDGIGNWYNITGFDNDHSPMEKFKTLLFNITTVYEQVKELEGIKE